MHKISVGMSKFYKTRKSEFGKKEKISDQLRLLQTTYICLNLIMCRINNIHKEAFSMSSLKVHKFRTLLIVDLLRCVTKTTSACELRGWWGGWRCTHVFLNAHVHMPACIWPFIADSYEQNIWSLLKLVKGMPFIAGMLSVDMLSALHSEYMMMTHYVWYAEICGW